MNAGVGAAGARIRVAVVFGGRSAEHAISCVTAGSVLRAIDRTRYDVLPIGISRAGRWVLAPDDDARLEIRDGDLPEVDASGQQVVVGGDPTSRGWLVSDPEQIPDALGAVDVVLPVLHGPYGEDGTIQGLLELAGIPYVGSGVLASALAMDKAMAKVVLEAAGLPVGPYVLLTGRDTGVLQGDALATVSAQLRLPVFVKPCRAGSSLGISKVETWDDLPAAIEAARAHDPKVIVEQAISGREIECGVLESEADEPPEVSVCAEIIVVGDHAFYDFEAKYLDGATEFRVPADLDPDTAAQARDMAARAFVALGCEGLARVDFFLSPERGLVVNEVNTMPGFTPVSMFPRAWAATGVDYPALVERLIRTALAKQPGLR